MSATATPRTDALHFDWKDGIDMQRHELLKLSRALERELAAMTAERAAAIASWDEERERAQREGMRVVAAEAENVALKKLVAKCKPAMELVLRDAVSLKLEGMAGVYQALLTEIDAALKGKK